MASQEKLYLQNSLSDSHEMASKSVKKVFTIDRTKWNRDTCYAEAKKYKSRGEFALKSHTAYGVARKKRWLNDYTWLEERKRPNGYWSREKCYEEAKKYKSGGEFQKKCGSAYIIARRKGWIKDYIWFEPPKNAHKWTRKTCYEEAKKFNSSGEFWKNSQSAYAIASRNGWMVDYTWFDPPKNAKKWNHETCYEEAKKYKSRVDFRDNARGAFEAAKMNKWLNEYTWFQKGVISDNNIYVVYCYNNEDTNSVYVGLANNMNRRHREHCKGISDHGKRKYDIVYRYFHSIGKEIPKPIILKKGLYAKEAQYYEKAYVETFNKEGMNVLNLAKTGSLGGYGRWTREMCYNEAKKYKSRWDFGKNNGSAYQAARRNGWLNDFTWLEKAKRAKKWNQDTCYEEAKKYTSRREFSMSCYGAYKIASKNGWLDEYDWFITPEKESKWTREACFNEAKKYKSRWDFGKNNSSAYNSARKNGWLADYTWFEKRWNKWNSETCLEEAKKYSTISDFKSGCSSAYSLASKNGWLDDYTWLARKQNKAGYWSREKCLNEAKKYSSRGEFQKNSKKAYMSAYKHGWLNDYTWLSLPKNRNHSKKP